MRLSYTDFRKAHYRAINMSDSSGNPVTDVNIDNQFNMDLGQGYQTILAKMRNYKTVKPYSFSTGNNIQTYGMPPGLVTIEGGYITVGSVNYPLQPINSRYNEEVLHAIQIQASTLPQFYFVEQDTFTIWPTPQATYSGVIYYHFRDRNLSVDDYITGTVSLTNGSNIVTGVGTTFTAGMVGRWLKITDTTVPGQGYWYRIIGRSSNTSITLGAIDGTTVVNWNNANVSGVTYLIGETPEIPEEMHSLLPLWTASNYYKFMRKDLANADLYDNMFWTGSGKNPSRNWDDNTIAAGLIGGINAYRDRDNRTVIKRKPRLNPLQTKVFATTLS